ncbi:MAG: hypothetical protein HYV09_32050 [Deltaproteobacteria bacterium]|nr:hypothetical protein [Deltaproteobacteria bacterium]
MSLQQEPGAAPDVPSAKEAQRDELAPPAGEVRFVSREEAVRLRGALDAARLLVVSVPELGPGARGRLGEVVDDAIEQALRDRGGALPGIGASSDRDAALSDQLYRVRKIGRVGVAIDLGPLGALVDACGALDPEDAAVLRFVAGETRERPVVLMLDTRNTEVRAYGAPLPLVQALGLAGCEALGLVKPVSTSTPEQPSLRARGPSMPRPPIRRPPPMRVAEAPAAAEPVAPAQQEPRLYVSIERVAPDPAALGEAARRLSEVTRATPLSALERAFVEGYAPLRSALLDDQLGAAGIGKADARALCAQFASAFARAYAEALPTFGVTGRHPRMIFELFDLAQRCARVHGARSTHVVLVDALRWDLGKRLRDRLSRELSRQAVCVEEHALWAVLPTTTGVQLDALVRGDDALRAPARPERETAIVRGRSLDVLRRVRLGHRDLVKLDLLEGRLRDAGAAESTRLDAFAEELTPILARYVSTSKPRALVVIAGDHGFAFGDPDDLTDEKAATPPARQGGGSPDEVFVPFQAWLVGGVH